MSRMKALSRLVVCLCFHSIAANSLSGMKNLVSIAGSHGSKSFIKRQTRSTKSAITGMHVTSVIRSRFAKVTTVSEMENRYDEAKEMSFSVRLPEAAFITEFTMLVDGITFIGEVKEKAIAEAEYQRAKAEGNLAGLVSANVRETQTFNVAANVPAHSSVTFTLVYQELLKRILGKYHHDIFVNPSQNVDDFVVDVYITEQIGITMLAASVGTRVTDRKDGGRKVDVATQVKRSKHQTKVSFKPTPTQQRRFLMIPETDRKMTVVYDVTRENLGGELLTRNGYFVHYFAPRDLNVLPKRIVFVIDRSGSMSGRKMQQTKVAFEAVLKDMSDADMFNIVDFSDDVKVWKSRLVSVTKRRVQKAIVYVKNIVASGGTNLNRGLLRGVKILKRFKSHDRVSSAIITLTDGDPTSGVTNEAQIRNNVKRKVDGKFPVFCIGFGNNLNHNFLKRLANDNFGIARKIYEDSDADLQLKGFFREVATPLLLKFNMTYSGSKTSDVSKINYEKYFAGSEVIVVGAKLDAEKSLKSRIVGTSFGGEVVYDVVSKEVDENFRHWYDDTGDFTNFIERIWAYYTIKELLKKKVLVDSTANITEIRSIIKRVKHLSLKYKFVTPMTSMVVVLPEDEISSTPSTATGAPPLPLCYMRGSSVPENIVIERVWCPYIFKKQKNSQPPQQDYSYYSDEYYSYDYSDVPPEIYYYSQSLVHLTPTKANNCSGILTEAEGNISSPAPHHADGTVYCEWDISLTDESWIDLYIVTLDTTKNEVVVSSKGKEIMNHHGGVGASEYFPVANNKVHIKMIIHPEDTKQPGIVISYAQFTPDTSSSTSEQALLETVFPNCGHNITSEDNQSGYITSPNYPSEYPENAKCFWILINNDTESQDLRLKVVDMDIVIDGNGQCGRDKMVVFMNGEGSKQKSLCGSQAGETFTSSEKVVKIEFTSDDDLESGGFKLFYKFVPK